MDAFSYLMVPGIGASSAEHWQSLWQRDLADARTVEQAVRDRPDIEIWLAVLNRTMAACRNPIILVAHSLGCALVAHWQERVQHGRFEEPAAAVAAAMLVAPGDVDIERPGLEAVRPFAPMPLPRFAFPSVVVASTDDPWVTAARSAHFARGWGSDYVCIGPMGHISVDSGCGPWPHGMEILSEFIHRQRTPHQ